MGESVRHNISTSAQVFSSFLITDLNLEMGFDHVSTSHIIHRCSRPLGDTKVTLEFIKQPAFGVVEGLSS